MQNNLFSKQMHEEELSKKFNAPQDVILGDVKSMLQQLADKGFIIE